ncbi:MAG: TetR/AcrR family transcriptional regulator [Bacteroidota bacterium]|nr:TetR/AcrR family transcriptional regulator [Bacteroidota bacterium]
MTKAERTREFIITKAAPLFNTKGVAGTSLSDILEVTKLAKGSLYVHFENKEALSHAVVDYQLAQLVELLKGNLSKQKTAKEKLFAYIDTFKDPVNPPLVGGCPLINFGMEADDLDQTIRKKVNALIQNGQAMIGDVIKQGKETGECKASWEPVEFATKMFAMIEGGIMMSRIAGNNKPMQVIAAALKKEIEENLN